MKKIIFLIFTLLISNIFNSCSDEIITIVDEYNPPYEIKAIPSNASISINFWSGVLANDFVGFNLYADTTSNFTNAILNADGNYPTVKVNTHTRSNFTLPIPGTYNNGSLYYITVTAYGTNELIENRYIETKINSIVPVIPREEGDGTGTTITAKGQTVGNIDATQNLVNASNGWKLQYFGTQSDFNSIVIITNNSFWEKDSYSYHGLYIFSNGSQLAKIWITDTNTHSYHWAFHNQANQWNGI